MRCAYYPFGLLVRPLKGAQIDVKEEIVFRGNPGVRQKGRVKLFV